MSTARMIAGCFASACVVLIFLLATGTSPAQAAPVSCANTTHTVVSSIELNAAIACHNAATAPTEIIIDGPITYPTPAGASPITQAVHQLTITGQGNTVAGTTGFALALVSTFAVDGAGTVVFNNVTIGAGAPGSRVINGIRTTSNAGTVEINGSTINSPSINGVVIAGGTVTIKDSIVRDAGGVGVYTSGGGALTMERSVVARSGSIGIQIDGSALVTIIDSTVSQSGREGVTRSSAGRLTITNSTVTGSMRYGIALEGSEVVIRDSTVSNSSWSNIHIATNTNLVVANSTVSEGDDGIEVQAGSVAISNSTFAGSGAKVRNLGGTVFADSNIIMEGCVGGAAVGTANFVQAGPSCGSASATIGSIGPLANNGCGRTQAALNAANEIEQVCGLTHLVSYNASSIDKGKCSDVVVDIDFVGNFVRVPPLTNDQRGAGFPRTTSTNCDAGALELVAVGTGDITILKKWDGGTDPRPPVTFTVVPSTANCQPPSGSPVVLAPGASSVTVSVQDISFLGSTTRCEYEVGEVPVAGYHPTTPQTQVEAGETVEFENEAVPVGSGEITIDKVWVGGSDPRPEVTFVVAPLNGCPVPPGHRVVFAPGQLTGSATVQEFVAAGDPTKCLYRVSESLLAGYTLSGTQTDLVAGDTASFTNTAVPVGSGEIEIWKRWFGGPEPRPDASFVVTSPNGCPVPADDVVLVSGAERISVTGLQEFVAAGDPTRCRYLVTENGVPGYRMQFSASNVTVGSTAIFENRALPVGSGDIVINKSWVGGSDPRPEVTFMVTPTNGCPAPAAVTLASGLTTTVSVQDMVADGDPTKCTYTISEAVPGYTSSGDVLGVSVGESASFVNTAINAGSGVITIEKSWAGGSDPRPPVSFTVTPTNGCPAPAAVTLASGSSVRVLAQNRVANGDLTLCVYDIAEAAVPGYTSSGEVAGVSVGESASFVNTAVAAGSGVITIEKSWAGGSDPRPPVSFTVTPTNGCPAPAAVTLASGLSTTVSVQDMVADGDPTKCTYDVAEGDVAGYTGSAPQTGVVAGGNAAFTNSAVPVAADVIRVTKSWVGVAGPAVTLTVTPTNGCTDPGAVTIAAGASFVDVVVDNVIGAGSLVACEFTIAEDPVAGYTPVQAEFTNVAPGESVAFVNVQDVGAAQLAIAKTWSDAGPHPDISFTVVPETPACGQAQTVTLTAGTAGALAAVADISSDGTATPCLYTVTEVPVGGFYPAVASFSGVVAGGTVSFRNFRAVTIVEAPAPEPEYPEGGFTNAPDMQPPPGGFVPNPVLPSQVPPVPDATNDADEVKGVTVTPGIAVTGMNHQFLAALGFTLVGTGAVFHATRRNSRRQG